MYEIAGLDKLIYDKKCRLVWNFIAANEIFILYDYYLFFLWKYFFSNSDLRILLKFKISNHWNYSIYIIFILSFLSISVYHFSQI